MSRADYDDPLYRECIPHRITPAPGSGRGPTAAFLASLEPEYDGPELVIDNTTVAVSGSGVEDQAV